MINDHAEVPRAALDTMKSGFAYVAKWVAGEKLPVTRKLSTDPGIQLSKVHIAAKTNF